jgi:hypothetical protein
MEIPGWSRTWTTPTRIRRTFPRSVEKGLIGEPALGTDRDPEYSEPPRDRTAQSRSS